MAEAPTDDSVLYLDPKLPIGLVAHPEVTLHPLLCPGNPISWDIRIDPVIALQKVLPKLGLSCFSLWGHATSPPMTELRITYTNNFRQWEIRPTNSSGVTVIDILEAIHRCFQKGATTGEWQSLTEVERHRISGTFDSRWRSTEAPHMADSHEVLKQDCLSFHGFFDGLILSMLDAKECDLVLTSRDQYIVET